MYFESSKMMALIQLSMTAAILMLMGLERGYALTPIGRTILEVSSNSYKIRSAIVSSIF